MVERPQPPGLVTKWEQQRVGGRGRESRGGPGRGRAGLPGWDLGTAESHDQSPSDSRWQCPGPTVCLALGEHFGLNHSTRPHTSCVPGPWTILIPHRRGSERCRPSPKVTQLVRGRLGFRAQDCGTPEPQLLTEMSHSPSQTVSWKSFRGSAPPQCYHPRCLSFSICTVRQLVQLPDPQA